MTIDLDELERKARAATPGPWEVRGKRWLGTVLDAHGMWVAECAEDHASAAHIAAASPDVVLALVQRVREAERELVRFKEAATRELRYDMAAVLSDTPENRAQARVAELEAALVEALDRGETACACTSERGRNVTNGIAARLDELRKLVTK